MVYFVHIVKMVKIILILYENCIWGHMKNEIQTLVAKYRKKPRAVVLLKYLLRAGSKTPAQIAEETETRQQVVSQCLKEFKVDGVIGPPKYGNRRDLRKKFYSLTEKGKNVAKYIELGER